MDILQLLKIQVPSNFQFLFFICERNFDQLSLCEKKIMNGTWSVSSDLIISVSVTNNTNSDLEVYYDSPFQLKITDSKGFEHLKKKILIFFLVEIKFLPMHLSQE